jgi:hypothetical protein
MTIRAMLGLRWRPSHWNAFVPRCPAGAGVAGGTEGRGPSHGEGRVPPVLRAHSRMIGLCNLRVESTVAMRREGIPM